jgi:zinc transport system substrate-binding protein
MTMVTNCSKAAVFGRGAQVLGVVLASLSAGMAGCERESSESADTTVPQGPLVIYTTFYPLEYLAERIGGEHVKVVCPCPADADPATWMPDDPTIQAYQEADLIVVNGASFESWIGKVTLPESRLVDTSAPYAEDFIMLEDAVTHSHGPSGAHAHEGIDGHTWLDPLIARGQADQILRALVKAAPVHKDAFNRNFDTLASDIDALNRRLVDLAPLFGKQFFLCSHPAYNYIGRRYGWQLKSYHFEPGDVPDDASIDNIRANMEENGARIILWESEPAPAVAARMESIGLANVVFRPCETLDREARASGDDYLVVMRRNVERLADAVGDLADE